jgi:peptidoglycan/xylan/chitin deacetylase (PgdA/CDA1 family)
VRLWPFVFAGCKAGGLALAYGHHLGLGSLLFFGPDPWLFLQFVHPRAQGFGPAATAFASGRREVWLTIDDGPDPASTPRVLELLAAHGARATFFVVGRQVAKHPELARRIVAEGHTLANHTDSHPAFDFWMAGPRRAGEEIDACARAIRDAGVAAEPYVRPPVGVRSPFLEAQLASRGLTMVLWTVRGFDAAGRKPEAALRRVASCIRPGAILLAHEAGLNPGERIPFVEMLLGHLRDKGYACVQPPRQALLAGGRPLPRRAPTRP